MVTAPFTKTVLLFVALCYLHQLPPNAFNLTSIIGCCTGRRSVNVACQIPQGSVTGSQRPQSPFMVVYKEPWVVLMTHRLGFPAKSSKNMPLKHPSSFSCPTPCLKLEEQRHQFISNNPSLGRHQRRHTLNQTKKFIHHSTRRAFPPPNSSM